MRRLIGFLVGLGTLACGDDDEPPTPPPPAELELVAPGSPNGAVPCVRRGTDLRQSITAQVSVRNFTLAPPGACTVEECGTVRFELEHGTQCWAFESAHRFASLSTLELPDGRYTLRAALYDAFGQPYRPPGEEAEEEAEEEADAPNGGPDGLACRDEKPCASCVRYFELDATCGEVEPEPAAEPSAGGAGSLGDAGAALLDAGGSVVDAGFGGAPALRDGGPSSDAGPGGSGSGGSGPGGSGPSTGESGDAGLSDAGFGGPATEMLDAAADAAVGFGAPDAGPASVDAAPPGP